MAKRIASLKSKPGKSNLTIAVYNIKGEIVGKTTLPRDLFDVKVHPQLLSQAVRVYLANQRSGTAKVKTRGEVIGSTRKIYRQKGTGRARHGDIKAPIFKGGGIAHGPKVRDYSRKFPQKMKKLALVGALSKMYQLDKIKVVNNLDNFSPKTKNMVELLNNLKLTDKHQSAKNLLVTDKIRNELYLSGRNIKNLTILPIRQLNTYQVLASHNLIFLKQAIETINQVSSKPNKNFLKETPDQKKILPKLTKDKIRIKSITAKKKQPKKAAKKNYD